VDPLPQPIRKAAYHYQLFKVYLEKQPFYPLLPKSTQNGTTLAFFVSSLEDSRILSHSVSDALSKIHSSEGKVLHFFSIDVRDDPTVPECLNRQATFIGKILKYFSDNLVHTVPPRVILICHYLSCATAYTALYALDQEGILDSVALLNVEPLLVGSPFWQDDLLPGYLASLKVTQVNDKHSVASFIGTRGYHTGYSYEWGGPTVDVLRDGVPSKAPFDILLKQQPAACLAEVAMELLYGGERVKLDYSEDNVKAGLKRSDKRTQRYSSCPVSTYQNYSYPKQNRRPGEMAYENSGRPYNVSLISLFPWDFY